MRNGGGDDGVVVGKNGLWLFDIIAIRMGQMMRREELWWWWVVVVMVVIECQKEKSDMCGIWFGLKKIKQQCVFCKEGWEIGRSY